MAHRRIDNKENDRLNETCITATAATIETLLGVPVREELQQPIRQALAQAERSFAKQACDRVFMYNPDAVAMWIADKYREYFVKMEQRTKLKLPMLSVCPPVTPVCFSSMYSGLQPSEHGIRKYEKPVLQVKTVFDDLPRYGKRAAIVSTEGDSISIIFRNRPVDYYIYPTKQECNNKALQLIEQDGYDLIVLYNGDYDYYMHRFSPEGGRPLRALRENISTYETISDAIRRNWMKHNTALVFAPDHGCHRTCLFLGNHGIERPCDMNIYHFYSFIPSEG